MILVPAGTFMMGADNGENAVLHEVTLTKSFWLGRYEVTNQQYVEYLNWAISHNRIHVSESTITGINVYSNVTEQILTTIRNGSGQWSEIRYIDSENRFTVEPSSWIAGDTGPGYAYPLGYDPSSLPVTAVSWHGAALYCNWLSNQESLEEYYGTGSGVGIPSSTGSGNPYNATGYRLPTSAEWERAARYNDSREYPWGDSEPNCDLANSRHGGVCLGWTSEASAYTEGESQLGFNCLAGNVNEWCNDRVYLYSPNPVTDPIGSTYAGNSQRVTRGGHYSSPASELQNYMGLDRADPGVVEWVYGFRVCRVYAVN
ncbi:MAG: SUMF1/EgtB/PvdO family nonheme iron enzyme [Calditrichaeota bacterium]|nr:SUMF1/EgtB/PvdO family nonheme iron enzyme [Calditrichota bacterium]MCB9474685.1 SUMF1/EgtB/PvdO family nonheme iron enzyme [Candidatus Delongbacteria bacterium]